MEKSQRNCCEKDGDGSTQKKQRTLSDEEQSDLHLPHTLFLTDPKLLHCFTCKKPLTIPAFQLDNEYLVCSPCSFRPGIHTGNEVCKFAAKLLKSLKFPCENTEHGCKETLRLGERNEHEKMCKYRQCSCPFQDCNIVTSSWQLIAHLRSRHSDSFILFRFGAPFSFPFCAICRKDSSVTILEEGYHGDLFVLVTDVRPDGTAITVCQIVSSPRGHGEFAYEIKAGAGEENHMRIRSSMSSIESGDDNLFSKTFLLIPNGLFPSLSDHRLEFKIWDDDEA